MKKILVCIKQVPDSESLTVPDSDSQWIKRHRNVDYRMNRYDEYALEEALAIREAESDTEVHVITAGPESAVKVIKRSLGIGADKGFFIPLNDDVYCDPFVVASLISKHIRQQGYDLVLTGIMSEDMMQAQTGQMIAGILELFCASSVVSLNCSLSEGRVSIQRELEGGVREGIDLLLPAVCTIQAGINTPRYPTLSNILKAESREVITVSVESVKRRQRVTGVRFPEKTRNGKFIEGSLTEKVTGFIEILHHHSLLRGAK